MYIYIYVKESTLTNNIETAALRPEGYETPRPLSGHSHIWNSKIPWVS